MSDYRAVPALLDMPVAKPKALLADKGYDGDAVREDLLWRGILPIIPPKANRREPPACDFRRYRDLDVDLAPGLTVIPANAGIQVRCTPRSRTWIPAFAGMTAW